MSDYTAVIEYKGQVVHGVHVLRRWWRFARVYIPTTGGYIIRWIRSSQIWYWEEV